MIGVFGYLCCKPLLVYLCGFLGTTGTSSGFTWFCFAHNVALAVFSFVVFLRAVSLVAISVSSVGVMDTYCTTENSVLMQGGFSIYVTLFYLSKYY